MPTPPGWTSRGCTPGTRRSTARWPSSAATSTRSGSSYEIVPGVPAFAAAAAALGRELTVPGVAQTVTLTRVATLSTAMPAGEDLRTLSAPGATLVLHLAAAQVDAIVPELISGGYRTRNALCGRGIRELAAGDGAAGARSATSPRGCTRPMSPARPSSSSVTSWPPMASPTVICIRRTGGAEAGTERGSATAAGRDRRGAGTGVAAASRRAGGQFPGGPGARSGAARRRRAHRRLRRRRGTAAVVGRLRGRRGGRRDASVRGDDHRQRREGVSRAGPAAPAAGPPGLAAWHCHRGRIRCRSRESRCWKRLFAGVPDHRSQWGRLRSPVSMRGS